MKIKNRDINGVTVMDFKGKITDGLASTQLRSRIGESLEEGKRQILLNLGGVKFIDSFGLSILIEAFNKVKDQGGALKLTNLNYHANKLMVITRLKTEIDCFDNEAEALQSF